jgi:hypothetical protein
MYGRRDLRFASAAWNLTQFQMRLNDLQKEQAIPTLSSFEVLV